MSCLVSVIVPVYNVEKYLDKCIESIINQSYQDLEIIIVDDGSTDSSGALADIWKNKDDRIRVIHKDNGGLSDARNVGLDCSNGDWITFVDSDDYLSKKAIELMLSVTESSNYDIVIAEAVHVFGNKEAQFYEIKKRKQFNSEDAICEMWYQKSFLPSAWGKMYKKEIWEKVRFTKGILYEDIDIMHELLYKAKGICYINAGIYAYVHHENSITTQAYSERDLYILDICKKIVDFASDKTKTMKKAARAYSIVGNMRIFLATYGNKNYRAINDKCKSNLDKNAYKVLLDCNIRLKLYLGIIIYYMNNRLFIKLHSKVNRWK